MATPTMVTITGLLVPLLDATEIRFKVPTAVRHNAGPSVLLPNTEYTAAVTNGNFTIQTPGTNDPAWSPANWTYKVTVIGPNLVYTFNAQVPYNAGTLAFSSILPSLPASDGTLYAAYNHVHSPGLLVLGPGDLVPPGTPADTVIVRTSS